MSQDWSDMIGIYKFESTPYIEFEWKYKEKKQWTIFVNKKDNRLKMCLTDPSDYDQSLIEVKVYYQNGKIKG